MSRVLNHLLTTIVAALIVPAGMSVSPVAGATEPALGRTCSAAQWGRTSGALSCALVSKSRYAYVQLAPGSTTTVSAPAPTTVSGPTTVAAQYTRTKPAPLGTAQQLRNPGAGIFDLVVDGFIPDATALVDAANSFNDPAAAGQRFALVHVRATFHATPKKDRDSLSVSWSAFGSAGVERKTSDCSAVIPDPLDQYRDLVDGGTIAGNVCLLITVAEAGGAIVIGGRPSPCFVRCSEAWWKLQ